MDVLKRDLPLRFDETRAMLPEALGAEGFGVLSHVLDRLA